MSIDHSLHSDLASEPQSKQLLKVQEDNQILTHNFQVSIRRQCVCALDGCTSTFELTLFPHQIVYPKYCPDHRNSWRREHFRRQLNQD
jgi:hypothetical protein